MTTTTWTRRSYGVADTGREQWRARVAEAPASPFLTAGGRTWTYAEGDDAIRRLAQGLAGCGVGQGTRVAVGMSNCAEAYFAHFALRELGAVLVGLVPGMTFDELRYPLEHSESEVLIVDDQIADTLLPRISEFTAVETVVVADDLEPRHGRVSLGALLASPPLEAATLRVYDDLSPSQVLYTSGSTAKPKGVVLPAGAVVTAGRGYAQSFGVQRVDNFVLPFTLAHGVGAIVVQGVQLHTGCHVTLEERFSPSVFWDRVEETAATVTLLFPAQLSLLLKLADEGRAPATNGLRLVITHSWNQDFRDRFDVELGLTWGSTETGAHGAGSGVGYRNEHGEGYIGPPHLDEEIAAFDEASDERLAPMEVGEIRLRHPHVMLEYLKDPENTAATLTDGWIRTGDHGLVTADGRLFFRGRVKNMIKRSGENISPDELEGLIAEHPDAVDVVVFGVPDPIRTQEVAVAAHVREASRLEPADVAQFVRERAAAWKVPRYVELVREPFPRLASGKIDRVKVTAAFDPDVWWDRERANDAERGARGR